MKTAELREGKTNNFKIKTKNKPFYQFSSKLKRVLRFRLASCVSLNPKVNISILISCPLFSSYRGYT